MSLCGWEVPSKSLSSKAIRSLAVLGFFPGRSNVTSSIGVVIFKIPLRRLAPTPINVAWITSIIPNVGGYTPAWFTNVCPMDPPFCLTTYFLKCLALTNYSKWTLNVLHCYVVCPLSQWYVQYKLWFLLVGSLPILLGQQKYSSCFILSIFRCPGSLNATLTHSVSALSFYPLASRRGLCWKPLGWESF